MVGANRASLRMSVRLSVRPSVRLSVAVPRAFQANGCTNYVQRGHSTEPSIAYWKIASIIL
jgi:hypothetical protein